MWDRKTYSVYGYPTYTVLRSGDYEIEENAGTGLYDLRKFHKAHDALCSDVVFHIGSYKSEDEARKVAESIKPPQCGAGALCKRETNDGVSAQ